ncbi:MAG: phospho-N-acetylmuramoyl-pentapeptide-transferase [Candidatus Dadabacteria bacterium]|nr:phospho-N-acetylmuramoyl-pentapeptide-transferase [Candidatus Dadabacteria bacterium]MCY4262817.1 phospho-N-acetylmuramoyl-pentapeptide-transferase [Candidatus Dadabacteria bacterium]
MLYFLHLLKDDFIFLNVFKYITFRSFGAGLTSFLLCIFLGKKLIDLLKTAQFYETIRDEGPSSHGAKAGTPTMGGIFIVMAITVSSLLWTNFLVDKVLLALLFTVSFAVLGFFDDFMKIKRGNGIRARVKFLCQMLIALAFIIIFCINDSGNFSMSMRAGEVTVYSATSVVFPFIKQAVVDFGYLYILFALLVTVGSSNAVNLTDGLDGLAIGSITIVATTYIIFAYLAGNLQFAEYLQIPHVQGAGELAIFLAAVGGACLGFLWYNSHPAQVFMGDVGSLSLGAAIGFSALMIKQELLLIVAGGIFFVETLSVIIQVISFRSTGKRVFRMTPLHHHFELAGWAESKIVIRFWIICVVLSILALSSLKIR